MFSSSFLLVKVTFGSFSNIFQADEKKNDADTKTTEDEKVEEDPKTTEDGKYPTQISCVGCPRLDLWVHGSNLPELSPLIDVLKLTFIS